MHKHEHGSDIIESWLLLYRLTLLAAGEETLAAIGVGGVPGGVLDEVCAQAGAAKVQERVNTLSVPKP